MSSDKRRVCIIGAGPCGMSAVFHFGQLGMDKAPDVVCYEKQADWGGLWNFSWRTGTDEYGEPCHSSMYHFLWANGPKEALEYPDYTFEKHFGHPIPSFPPRAVLRDYLEGRWNSSRTDLRKFIKFNTLVRRVEYNAETNDFGVWTKNLTRDEDSIQERFDYVLVATGIFSTPNVPNINGLDQFPGRIVHSHNFRDAREFQNQKLLIVGASYSAEDVALQCRKYGSGNVICSWKTKPMGFKWPKGIEERPLVQRFEHKTAFFKDGSSAEVDSVILCTGYLNHFPFLSGNLRLKSNLCYYPDGLYKGTVFLGGGNNSLLYLGVQNQYYSYTMFDVQALWACKYIMGDLVLPSRQEMLADIKRWRDKMGNLGNYHEEIDFQTEFVSDLIKDTGYPESATKVRELLYTWEDNKHENISTYRDQSFSSIFTGTQSPPNRIPFMDAYDDSLDTFVNQTQNTATKSK